MISNQKQEIEILAPAGSIDSMKAAFYAGADAVYMGGSRFGARAFANNPDEEELKRAIDYAHLHHKKIYLTMNTLFKEKELEEEACRFLKPYYEQGLDAILVQDTGLLSMLKDRFPGLPIHASTQMTITGNSMTRWLEKQGLERIVLSRELSLEELQNIRSTTSMEMEVFVQGALCYCYSGQCLMSSFIGGRSGNRGRCAQPCRLPYQAEGYKQNSYLLSPKDICTLNDIPDLADCGVNSFKIEGRMKKPEYAALTAWLYRHYTDQYLTYGREKFHIDPKDVERLMDLYNRGGFSGGYFHQYNSEHMIFTERPNHLGVPAGKTDKKGSLQASTTLNPGDVVEVRRKDGSVLSQWTISSKHEIKSTLKPPKNVKISPGTSLYRVRNASLIESLEKEYIGKELKEKISGFLRVMKDMPVILRLQWNNISIELKGPGAEAAKNQPMTEEQLKKPMLKTGNTPFVFDDFHVETDGLCYIPNSQLNELRREALSRLEKRFLEQFFRKYEDKPVCPVKSCASPSDPVEDIPPLYVMITGNALMSRSKILSGFPEVKRVYMELHEAVREDFSSAKLLKSSGKEIFFSLPGIFRQKDQEKLKGLMSKARLLADGWIVHQLEMALFVREICPDDHIVLNSGVYAMNRRSKEVLKSIGSVSLTAPVELNYQELRTLGCRDMELTVYGHQTLMVSAQCIKRTLEGCTKRPEMLQLTDRQHKHFYAYNECEFCYNRIYNGLPTMLMDKKKELLTLHPSAFRMHFTMESGSEIKALLESFRNIYIREINADNILKDFTRGHFTRGIE